MVECRGEGGSRGVAGEIMDVSELMQQVMSGIDLQLCFPALIMMFVVVLLFPTATVITIITSITDLSPSPSSLSVLLPQSLHPTPPSESLAFLLPPQPQKDGEEQSSFWNSQ